MDNKYTLTVSPIFVGGETFMLRVAFDANPWDYRQAVHVTYSINSFTHSPSL